MGEIENKKGCTLMFSFKTDESQENLQCDEMLEWLKSDSGLSAEYFEKIVHVQHVDNVLKITFDKTANCFIAMRDIKKRKIRTCRVLVTCPTGKFQIVNLIPETSEFLSKTDVIESMKCYGEIIQMMNNSWYDAQNTRYILTGEVSVYILTDASTRIPDELIIGKVRTKIEHLTYTPHYEDKIMQELWDNRKSDQTRQVDYTKKTFLMQDKEPGNAVVCTFLYEGNYTPNETDVYLWLIHKSGLSDDYLKKIMMFKMISKLEYHVIFDKTVNCFIAMRQMGNRKVYHSRYVWNDIEISCPKGNFKRVTLKPRTTEKFSPLKDVKNSLEAYGVVFECERLRSVKIELGNVACDFKCEMLVKEELPRKIKDDNVDVDVYQTDADLQTFEEERLIELWDQLTL